MYNWTEVPKTANSKNQQGEEQGYRYARYETATEPRLQKIIRTYSNKAKTTLYLVDGAIYDNFGTALEHLNGGKGLSA